MERQTHRPIRVLLIASDESGAEIVRRSLPATGVCSFAVEQVASLREGLVRLGSGDFDAAVVDLCLPDASVSDTVGVLAGYAAQLPVVALSDGDDAQMASALLAQGVQECVAKEPGELARLPRTLRHCLTRHRLVSELRAAEHRLGMLSEQLPAVLWTTDAELRFTSWRGGSEESAAGGRLLGRMVEELSQNETEAARTRLLHLSALAGQTLCEDLRWEGRWYHAHLEPLRTARGEVVGTIGVALDVTHERKLMNDIEAAHRVQRHLLPAAEPRLAGFEIGGACYPAADCSGDFYDYIALSAGRLAIVLADVAGHGFGPAIIAAAIRSYLRAAAVLGHQVHEMLAICNWLLTNDAEENPFATVFLVRLEAGSGALHFTGAGQIAHMLRSGGGVEVLQTACVPVGVREDECFSLSRPVHMEPGDILLLASDGVFDTRRAQGDDRLGVAAVMEALGRWRDRPATEIVDKLYRLTREFAGGAPPEDDLTVVVVKRLADPKG